MQAKQTHQRIKEAPVVCPARRGGYRLRWGANSVSVALAALVVVAAGCGGGGNSGNYTGSATTPGATATPASVSRGQLTLAVVWPARSADPTRAIPTNANSLRVEIRPVIAGQAVEPLVTTLQRSDGTALDSSVDEGVSAPYIPRPSQTNAEQTVTVSAPNLLYGEYQIKVTAKSGSNGTGTTLAAGVVSFTVNANDVPVGVTLDNRISAVAIVVSNLTNNGNPPTTNSPTLVKTAQNDGTPGTADLTGQALDFAGNTVLAPGGTFAWSKPSNDYSITISPATSDPGVPIKVSGLRSTYVSGTATPVTVTTVYTRDSLTRSTTVDVNVLPSLSNISVTQGTGTTPLSFQQGETVTLKVTAFRANSYARFRIKDQDGNVVTNTRFTLTDDVPVGGIVPPGTDAVTTTAILTPKTTKAFGSEMAGDYTIEAFTPDTEQVTKTQRVSVQKVMISLTNAAAINPDATGVVAATITGTVNKTATVTVTKGATSVTDLVLPGVTGPVNFAATSPTFKPLNYTTAQNRGIKYHTNGQPQYVVTVTAVDDPQVSDTQNRDVNQITLTPTPTDTNLGVQAANGTNNVSVAVGNLSNLTANTSVTASPSALVAVTSGPANGVTNLALKAGSGVGTFTYTVTSVFDPDVSVVFRLDVKGGFIKGIVQ